ncbi:MAG: hypothetical protein J1E07_10445 [Treponema sp.]|nr:hypothetical protein [Treponema sp.]
MKSIKKYLLFVMMCAAVVGFMACSDDDDDDDDDGGASVVTRWKGVDGDESMQFQDIVFYDDGTVIGTWGGTDIPSVYGKCSDNTRQDGEIKMSVTSMFDGNEFASISAIGLEEMSFFFTISGNTMKLTKVSVDGKYYPPSSMTGIPFEFTKA